MTCGKGPSESKASLKTACDVLLLRDSPGHPEMTMEDGDREKNQCHQDGAELYLADTLLPT